MVWFSIQYQAFVLTGAPWDAREAAFQAGAKAYQKTREGQGAAMATIDMEISIAQTMVTNAFDNDKIDGRALKAFRATKRKLSPGAMPEIGFLQ